MPAPTADAKSRSLPPRQQRFVDEYLVDSNATQAAIRAGYSARTAKQQGSRLLTKADVEHAVAAGKAKLGERTRLTQDWVLERLQENAKRAMQAEAARDKDGVIIGDYQYQGSVANRAYELIGKHIGMFVERKDVNVTGKFTHLSEPVSETDGWIEGITAGAPTDADKTPRLQ